MEYERNLSVLDTVFDKFHVSCVYMFTTKNCIETIMKNIILILSIWGACPLSECYSQGENPCRLRHDVGRIVLYGGLDPFIGGSNYFQNDDCLTGNQLPVGSCVYPKGSSIGNLSYGYGWIGGVVDGDTLVSGEVILELYRYEPGSITEWEFHSHFFPFTEVETRSTLDPTSPKFKNAISEQDFISVTSDTVTEGVGIFKDYFHQRPHVPMGLEVVNRSYAWSIGYAEDFIIYDWTIRNIGSEIIHDAYFGISMYSSTGYLGSDVFAQSDDIEGFLQRVPSIDGCGFADTVLLMWIADNDGDPVNAQFVIQPTVDPALGEFVVSCRSVIGIELFDSPKEMIPGSTISYNWWRGAAFAPNLDFGPRHKKSFRDFRTGGGLGTPYGDINQYYIMRNGEIDYDQAYTFSITQFDDIWLYPRQDVAADVSDGAGVSQLLSVGLFDIPPGGEVPIVFSLVMGENFHKNPRNLANLPYDPDEYYANLDFSDLILNAQMARFIYDNPGVDTDGDGYAGEFRVCVLDSVLDVDSTWIASVAETTYYKGDGVPDWKAALPPPAPKMWVTPNFRGIHIRFNGSESETSKDIFTRMNDFEGYQVYLSRDDREQSYSLIASYDIENYDKYIWNEEKQPDPGWELLDFPATLQEIRCKYAYNCNDSAFDPLRFRPSQPYQLLNYPESLFYWVKHQWNVSEFGVTSDIKKRYPLARDPTKVPADSLTPDDYTDDGYLKYFDYEFTIEDILPTVPYYVSVTAFDFGWPKSNLEPLETSITENAQQVFASIIDSAFGGNYNQVVVYPNPYRKDENYRQRGFEGLGNEERSNERVRRIHFANLPPKCIIKILSLDGDLVREIHHDKDPNDPTASHEEWGLISRNGLAVVSGLYYWVVESDDGTVQMGKLAIIL